MIEVVIVPTIDTSYGIDDKYDIKTKDVKVVLKESLSHDELVDFIKKSDYKVVGGGKYL